MLINLIVRYVDNIGGTSHLTHPSITRSSNTFTQRLMEELVWGPAVAPATTVMTPAMAPTVTSYLAALLHERSVAPAPVSAAPEVVADPAPTSPRHSGRVLREPVRYCLEEGR